MKLNRIKLQNPIESRSQSDFVTNFEFYFMKF